MTTSPLRGGMALVLVIGMMTILLALATSLTDITVNGMKQSVNRQEASKLHIGTESLANLGLAYLQQRSDLEVLLAETKAAGTGQSLLYRYASTGGRTVVDQTLAETVQQRFGSFPAFNGIDTELGWTWVATVNVELFGTRVNQDLFRLSATGGVNGPARLYVYGSQRPIGDINTYRRRRVEVLFTPYPVYSFRQAMWARRGYEFMGAATTDSWNSNSGSVGYGASPKGTRGDLTSEGEIVVQKPTNVQGTATSNASIPLPNLTYNPTGTETPLPGPSIGAYGSGGPLASGRYRCASLTLSSTNSITFATGADVTIYVDGPIQIRKTWDLRASGNPKRVVLIQNNYDSNLGTTTINGNITVGNPDNPAAFQYYTLYDGTIPDATAPVGIDFKMNGTATYGGIILAPYASFQLNGTFNYYGALLADSFGASTGQGRVNGSFSFHYDESLGQVQAPFPPNLVVVGWNTLDLPPAEWRDRTSNLRWDDP